MQGLAVRQVFVESAASWDPTPWRPPGGGAALLDILKPGAVVTGRRRQPAFRGQNRCPRFHHCKGRSPALPDSVFAAAVVVCRGSASGGHQCRRPVRPGIA